MISDSPSAQMRFFIEDHEKVEQNEDCNCIQEKLYAPEETCFREQNADTRNEHWVTHVVIQEIQELPTWREKP
jgi:hypothetical protein